MINPQTLHEMIQIINYNRKTQRLWEIPLKACLRSQTQLNLHWWYEPKSTGMMSAVQVPCIPPFKPLFLMTPVARTHGPIEQVRLGCRFTSNHQDIREREREKERKKERKKEKKRVKHKNTAVLFLWLPMSIPQPLPTVCSEPSNQPFPKPAIWKCFYIIPSRVCTI